MSGEADRQKWNARYRDGTPDFASHPLVAAALAAGVPDGPVLELACGPSGSALALAAAGRRVVALDVSDVALAQLRAEAARRGLAKLVQPLEADLAAYTLPPAAFALVLATRFWDPAAFRAAAAAVFRGGLLAWETFTLAEQRYRPGFPAAFCLADGEPATLLPDDFTVLETRDLDDGASATRRLLARRAAAP